MIDYNFVAVPVKMVEDKDITAIDIRVFLTILKNENKWKSLGKEDFYNTREWLIKETGICRNTFTKCIKHLKDLGYIKVGRKKKHYEISYDKLKEEQPVQATETTQKQNETVQPIDCMVGEEKVAEKPVNENIPTEKKYHYYLKKSLGSKILSNNKNKIETALRYKEENTDKRTVAESTFRNFLFKHKIQFEEQKVYFFASPNRKIEKFYIADFFIKSLNKIVEIDGGYHGTEEQKELDLNRDKDFARKGIGTIRIPNGLVNNERFVELKLGLVS